MNILYLSRTMDQGGAEKIVYQLAVSSKKQGHNVWVASSGGSYVPLLEEFQIEHISIQDLECKKPAVILQSWGLLKQTIVKKQIDIIHTHHRMAAFYAYFLKRQFPEIQLVYTAHNVFLNKRWLTSKLLTTSEIVAVGNSVKKNLIEFFGIPESSIKVIYNAVQPEKIEPQYYNKELIDLKKERTVLVGMIGRLSEQKGIDIFIQAIKISRHKNPAIRGVIIGDGELREKVEEWIEKSELTHEIVMLGFQRHIITLISQLDFLVMPSRWEGFPLTPIEAFLVGKTIAASDIDGLNEVVKNNESGLLVPKDDVEGFSHAILELAENSKLREKLEINGKSYYKENFEFGMFTEKYQKLYDDMMAN
ncbi:MAG: glycosyltransferase family 4 protein [Lachnospiraceae bacterium]|nr:glycosyltransferase family 4 protein [Lachnospiraceae bacterium]